MVNWKPERALGEAGVGGLGGAGGLPPKSVQAREPLGVWVTGIVNTFRSPSWGSPGDHRLVPAVTSASSSSPSSHWGSFFGVKDTR